MAANAAFDVELARALIERRRSTPGATLPILHDLSDQFGYIDDAAIPLIAETLNVSKAETLGVVSFYHDFRRAPVDGRILKLCRAESCQAMGCEDLVAHLEARHGIKADAEVARRRCMSKPSIAWEIARFRLSALLDGEPMAVSTAIASTRCRQRPRKTEMSVRIFVPRNSSALSVGADTVARRVARGARAAASRRARAHRLARPVLAGAAGRSRDARRAASASVRSRREDAALLFKLGFAAARIPRRSGGSRRFDCLADSSA